MVSPIIMAGKKVALLTAKLCMSTIKVLLKTLRRA